MKKELEKYLDKFKCKSSELEFISEIIKKFEINDEYLDDSKDGWKDKEEIIYRLYEYVAEELKSDFKDLEHKKSESEWCFIDTDSENCLDSRLYIFNEAVFNLFEATQKVKYWIEKREACKVQYDEGSYDFYIVKVCNEHFENSSMRDAYVAETLDKARIWIEDNREDYNALYCEGYELGKEY